MTGGGFAEARRQLDAVAEANPQWQAWTTALGMALREAENPAWRAAVPVVGGDHAEGVPLLGSATIAVDRGHVEHFLWELMQQASEEEQENDFLARLDGIQLLQAAVGNDLEGIDRLALGSGIDQSRLRSVAQLLTFPLLQACGGALAQQGTLFWFYGYCPVCGAWPSLAESRGLARERRLRCGRCGSDWSTIGTRCPFCDNSEHATIGMLVPESEAAGRRIEICRACRGYLKIVATLGPWKPAGVMLADLKTVDLDVAALSHGYARPSSLGYPLDVHIYARADDPAHSADPESSQVERGGG